MKRKKYWGIIFLSIPILIFFSCTYNKMQVHGAEIYSIDSVKYGRFEVKIKMASGNGVISSFFLYNHNSAKGKSFPWREIDLEFLWNSKRNVHTNIITGKSEARVMSSKRQAFKTNLSDDFHIYTIEWTPEYVAWYIDQELIRRAMVEYNPQIAELQNQYLSYRFNIWPSWKYLAYRFFGRVNDNMVQTVDYMKYYEYNAKGEFKFNLVWTDDFNTLDKNRWNLADWTFPENMSVFDPDNILVENGRLYLKLTNHNTKIPE